jgi:hypothetical protein
MYVHTDNWLNDWLWQKTDPTSRQRGRPHRQDCNFLNLKQQKNKFLVICPRWGTTPRQTGWLADWLSVVMWLWLWDIGPHIVTSAPDDSECWCPTCCTPEKSPPVRDIQKIMSELHEEEKKISFLCPEWTATFGLCSQEPNYYTDWAA